MTNGNGSDQVQLGWGDWGLRAKGSIVVLLIVQIVCTILLVYMMDKMEDVRRIVEQEARLEVSAIKATQMVIVNSVSRNCGVPGLEEELQRIRVEYKGRLEHINKQRDQAGIPRVSAPPIKASEQ